MSGVMDVIASETKGKSYKTAKYSLDGINVSSIDYDDHDQITWKAYGEDKPPKSREEQYLKPLADQIRDEEPLFCYFLDGSRRTFKIDDIAYQNRVFPVIAGQIGISCCKRVDREMKPYAFERRIAITLPKVASQQDWARDLFFSNLKEKINSECPILHRAGMEITDIRPYSTKKDEFERIENKGIAVIHDIMIEREIDMVSTMVKKRVINYTKYLMKDGSLEYKVDHLKNSREKRLFQNNFRYVVGVSKSFNPENCIDKNGKNNSNMIADLPLYCRTPVSMYSSPRLEGMQYAVWYLRIRDKRYTTNTFDGILKLEKILDNMK